MVFFKRFWTRHEGVVEGVVIFNAGRGNGGYVDFASINGIVAFNVVYERVNIFLIVLILEDPVSAIFHDRS